MTSSAQSQRAFERAAINGLASYLRSLGHKVEELGHPEDDLSSPLTIDAEWRIDNEPWAVEHSRIVYDPRAIPAEEAAERYLRPRLEAIARKYGVWLQLGFYAPRWQDGELPTKAWESFVALAERAASTLTFLGDAKGNSVAVREGYPAVTFAFIAAENAALGAQFTAALGEPLRAKLTGQLAVAKWIPSPPAARPNAWASSRSGNNVDSRARHSHTGRGNSARPLPGHCRPRLAPRRMGRLQDPRSRITPVYLRQETAVP